MIAGDSADLIDNSTLKEGKESTQRPIQLCYTSPIVHLQITDRNALPWREAVKNPPMRGSSR